MDRSESKPRRVRAAVYSLFALLLLAGAILMIRDAASGAGPEGRVRAPQVSPATVALAGALRLLPALAGFVAAAGLLRRGPAPARCLQLFGVSLAALSLAEPWLLGLPTGWPAAAGLVAGLLAMADGRRLGRHSNQ